MNYNFSTHIPGVKDKLAAAKRKLVITQNQTKEACAEINAKIEQAKDKNIQSDVKRWQSRLEGLEASTQRIVAKAQDEISQLQFVIDTDLAAQRDKARAQLDIMREKALKAWLDEGGDQDNFDQAWPEMEKGILVERTVETLTPEIKRRSTINF